MHYISAAMLYAIAAYFNITPPYILLLRLCRCHYRFFDIIDIISDFAMLFLFFILFVRLCHAFLNIAFIIDYQIYCLLITLRIILQIIAPRHERDMLVVIISILRHYAISFRCFIFLHIIFSLLFIFTILFFAYDISLYAAVMICRHTPFCCLLIYTFYLLFFRLFFVSLALCFMFMIYYFCALRARQIIIGYILLQLSFSLCHVTVCRLFRSPHFRQILLPLLLLLASAAATLRRRHAASQEVCRAICCRCAGAGIRRFSHEPPLLSELALPAILSHYCDAIAAIISPRHAAFARHYAAAAASPLFIYAAAILPPPIAAIAAAYYAATMPPPCALAADYTLTPTLLRRYLRRFFRLHAIDFHIDENIITPSLLAQPPLMPPYAWSLPYFVSQRAIYFISSLFSHGCYYCISADDYFAMPPLFSLIAATWYFLPNFDIDYAIVASDFAIRHCCHYWCFRFSLLPFSAAFYAVDATIFDITLYAIIDITIDIDAFVTLADAITFSIISPMLMRADGYCADASLHYAVFLTSILIFLPLRHYLPISIDYAAVAAIFPPLHAPRHYWCHYATRLAITFITLYYAMPDYAIACHSPRRHFFHYARCRQYFRHYFVAICWLFSFSPRIFAGQLTPLIRFVIFVFAMIFRQIFIAIDADSCQRQRWYCAFRATLRHYAADADYACCRFAAFIIAPYWCRFFMMPLRCRHDAAAWQALLRYCCHAATPADDHCRHCYRHYIAAILIRFRDITLDDERRHCHIAAILYVGCHDIILPLRRRFDTH